MMKRIKFCGILLQMVSMMWNLFMQRVVPMFVSSIWKLQIPPRVHFFLWLLSNNWLLTRDNLSKRREVHDPSCLFCAEDESISHLFFQWCISSTIWSLISGILDLELGGDFESVARLWVANKKHVVTNIITVAVLWSIWKLRNELMHPSQIRG